MRALVIVLLAACSNAANPTPDAYLAPLDAFEPGGGDDASGTDGSMQPGGANRILVVNEVCAGDTPDWVEIVNATTEPVQLADFAYFEANDAAAATPFPAMMLGPGAFYVQNIDDATSGFKLGSDEAIYVFRISDGGLSDSADWAEGGAPAGMSYRRMPNIFGPFATGAASKGVANP
jgi:hypothetical protein